jgi:hypothetical protein
MTHDVLYYAEASWLAPTLPCHGTSTRHVIKEFDFTLAVPRQLGSLGRGGMLWNTSDNEASMCVDAMPLLRKPVLGQV